MSLLLLCSVTLFLLLDFSQKESLSEETYFLFFLPILATIARSLLVFFAIFFYLICEELAFCVLFLRFSYVFGSVIHFTIISIMGKNYTITAAVSGAFGALLPWFTRTRSRAPTVLVAYSRWFRAVALYFLLFLQVFILVSFAGVICRVGRSSFFRLGDYFLTFFN